MLETLVLAVLSLGIVLYFQARATAREIRGNRARRPGNLIAQLILRAGC